MKEKVLSVTLNPSIDKTIQVEELKPYELNRVLASRVDPGGKGINVAKALKNFGVEAVATGLIAGKNGQNMLEELQQAGITLDFYEIEGETRTNIKIVDLDNQKTTEINEKGFLVTEKDLNGFREKYQSLLKFTDVVVLSGSLPPGIPSDFYYECISLAKLLGKKVILDADGDALKQGLLAAPFAIKPNLQELETILELKLNDLNAIIDAAKQFIQKGIEIVIVSIGADGAVIGNKDHFYKADTWPVKVKGATGSGDSMVAALAYSILKNSSLEEIARITTAAGTITASKDGSQICDLNDVLNSLNRVELHKI
ncbi:MAG: 1-phosphofructokinase [Anaerolineaceae bacterium]|nr:1-phosphofructokinase [Anaerolineaceae bacterium]